MEIGSWVIERPIGAGSTAIVYEAHLRENPNIKAALKVFKKGLESKLSGVFVREITAISRLDHPNIVKVLDWGVSPYFIAYELLDKTLEDKVCNEVINFETGMNIWFNVADAIAYAHSRGVVHRDLNPRNIMFDFSGLVKVVDFGISTVVEEKIRSTLLKPKTEEAGVGTYFWSAPEQFQGINDERSDIYSLGKLLHYLATSGGILPEKFTRVHLEPYKYPEELKDVVYDSCRENPEDRIQSVVEQISRVREALEEAGNLGEEKLEENYLVLGDFYYAMMNYPMAERCYRRALRDNPEDSLIVFKLADCLLKQGKWTEAEKYFKRFIKMHPSNAYAWYLLGLTLYYQGKIREAAEAFQKSSLLNPYYYSSWLWLGLMWSYLGLSAQAINAFNQAFSLNPQLSLNLPCPDCRGGLLWNFYKGLWYCPKCRKYYSVEEVAKSILSGFGFL